MSSSILEPGDCLWCGQPVNNSGSCSSCAAVEPDWYDYEHDEKENRWLTDTEGMPE